MSDDPFEAFRRRYREKCVVELARLRSALGDRDLAALRDTAHRLAGNGGTFGFPAISDMGTALELAVDEGLPFASIAEAAETLMSELEATVPRA